MSSTTSPGAGVPCPREVWRAALAGKPITIHVQPENEGSTLTFRGEVTDRRKVGNANYASVTIRLVPCGELADVEIEAEKDRDGWGPFRAFHWQQPHRPESPEDYAYQFIGRVTKLEIEGVRDHTTGPTPTTDSEVSV